MRLMGKVDYESSLTMSPLCMCVGLPLHVDCVSLNQISLSLSQFSHAYCGEHVNGHGQGQMTPNMTLLRVRKMGATQGCRLPKRAFLLFYFLGFQPIKSNTKRNQN